MKWALLSVWDKIGIIDLARTLEKNQISIMSSGGTARILRMEGIPVLEVAEYTQSPEMMDGRLKTLHPRIHGGLLGRRGIDDQIMASNGIYPIDLLIVNLYPFEQMQEQPLTFDEMIEFIDIGGPAMIRAAAKNHRNIAVIVDPADYRQVKEAVTRGRFTSEERLYFAKKAFARTAAYDAAISNYLQSQGREFPEILFSQFRNGRALRYGENPHQKAAIYGEKGIAGLTSLQGKIMSYNNYLDVHAAVGLLREFEECCTVIVKHNNPCGVATGDTLRESYITAREVDPISAYGSIVACNRELDADAALEMVKTFVEVVIAPSYTEEAMKIFLGKENLRVLNLPAPALGDEFRSIDGGVLLQRTPPYQEKWRIVSRRPAEEQETAALQFAWRVCKYTRSNAIVFANARKTLGIGGGQTSRLDSTKIAIMKARESLKGSVVGSDAFLPFPDTLELASEAGATALVQPGGSIRDAEVIAAADRLNMAMIFTGVRYFRH
ncbi:MAG: bifunctional phosphoribosylaminoimidazolecarboxamide formyltransferase/IMP cyclohydrolase [Methanomicrobiales archaeon]|nr:bifunctional phosphoribosylaminoimidazolecarboxamide formyltransferase/IMP cyclohydrolase [Methanomicrobiales archaeon]